MPTATRSKLDPNVVHLDFRGLRPRGGGKRAHVPEGDYLLEVTKAEHKPVANGVNKGKPQVAWQFKIAAVSNAMAHLPEARSGIGDSVYLNTRVDKDSKGLFFLRNLVDDLMADKLAGKSTTGAELDLRLDDKVGLTVGATLVDGKPWSFTDEETGEEVTRISSEIKYTYPASKFNGSTATQGAPSAEEDDEEEETPPPAPKARQNGAATAQAAAEAVTEADDDEDIDELDIQSL